MTQQSILSFRVDQLDTARWGLRTQFGLCSLNENRHFPHGE